ncbi:hypothetical protein WJX72_008576 [[Myrmecia] bisecta]|uniref:Uncharacterized protein n=1 Tax=[Myrmecia] bisecta TaxID=41462 RepID=A0AAW1PU85_9CHLO
MLLQHAGCSGCIAGLQTRLPSHPVSRPGARYRRACVVRAGALSPYDTFDDINSHFQRMEQEFGRIEKQMDRDLNRVFEQTQRTIEKAEKEGRVWRDEGSNWRSFGREHKYEAPGARSQYREFSIIYGTQPHTVPVHQPTFASAPLIIATLLAAVYALLTTTFLRNFDLTRYLRETRWKLALLWPVLLVTSENFREDFLRAVRGLPSKRRQANQGESGGETKPLT